ncbi:hypothetical protein L873DRAFT_1577429, partial [Choiromyces venosus 120613-1]
SIRSSAEKYGITYSTLCGGLNGQQSRVFGHLKMQELSKYEERSVARWCERLDEHEVEPTSLEVKSIAEAIIAWWEKNQPLGKHWITHFLSHHPDLAVKLSSRLDGQQALASNPLVIKDYF